MDIYLVGGAVRDKLLGLPASDNDWVVVGSSVDEMLKLGYRPVGKDFPVFIHPETGEEYALARTERKSGKGYTGFKYYADSKITLEQDLLRRDLSINAIAMDSKGIIKDPHNGQKDIKQRLLRHVSPAFTEDPLRVLRVARFAARFYSLGFKIAPETIDLMRTISQSDELEYLKPERVWQEFKLALTEQNSAIFLKTLQQVDAIRIIFPELTNICTPEKLESFTTICTKLSLAEQKFACLLALEPNIQTEEFCHRLTTSNTYRELALSCSLYHQKLSLFDQLAAEIKLDIIQSLDIIRRPQKLNKLQPCIQALHPDIQINSLQSIINRINETNPKELIKSGLKGKLLGKEIKKCQLKICQEFSN